MWCPDVMHPCFTGYSDYGDYWRANYEADYPEEYKYSRDQLIKDVEKTFEQVEAGKSSHLGHGVVFCDGGLTCINVVKEDEICSKLAILSLHGINRCWETYMTFKSAATLGPAWSPWAALPKAGKTGALQIHVSPPGRDHGGRCVAHGVDDILDTPHLKLAILPPLYPSRTSGTRIWTQHLSPEAGGKAQLQV